LNTSNVPKIEGSPASFNMAGLKRTSSDALLDDAEHRRTTRLKGAGRPVSHPRITPIPTASHETASSEDKEDEDEGSESSDLSTSSEDPSSESSSSESSEAENLSEGEDINPNCNGMHYD
jgi:hypothetical protein